MLSKIFWGVALVIFSRIAVAAVPVNVSDLPPMTVDTVGVDTPFDADVWGIAPDVAVVSKHIGAMADIPLTRPQLLVLRQLLLTDVGGITALDNANGAFLRARLDVFMRQGLFEDALTLIRQIPDKQRSADMRRVEATALFGLGQADEACADSMMAAFTGAEAAFIRAACVRETGSAAEASLAFDVYREGEVSAFVFGTAAGDKLYRGLDVQLPESGVVSVWEVPLVGAAFGDAMLKQPLSRGELRTLALNPRISPAVRVRAAERAYLSATDWAAVLAEPIAFGENDAGAVRRAGAYQAILAAKDDDTRAQAVRNYLTLIEQDGVLEAVAPIAVNIALSVRPEASLVDLAPVIIRILALNGEVAAATEWYRLWQLKDGAEALRLAAVMNALGVAVSESGDALIDRCLIDKTCDADLAGLPFYVPVSLEAVLRVPADIVVGYPGFVTAAVQKEIGQGAVGIGLLSGLRLLSSSDAPERPLIEVMGTVLPKGMADALLMERLTGAGRIIKTH